MDAAGERHARMRMRDRKKQEATFQRAGSTLQLKTELPVIEKTCSKEVEEQQGTLSVEVQTDMTSVDLKNLEVELNGAYQEIAYLKATLAAAIPFTEQFLQQI